MNQQHIIVLFVKHWCNSGLILLLSQLFKLEDVAMGIWIQQYKNSGQQVKHCDWWPVLQWRVRCWLRPCPLPDPEAYDVSVGEAEDGISSYMLWIASKLQVGRDRGMDRLAFVLNKTLAEILTLGGKCIGTMLKKPATLGYHFMFLVFWWKMLIHVLRWML